ncbi:MAG: TrbI/VirB10 family protein [Janthinobacterium lividum]
MLRAARDGESYSTGESTPDEAIARLRDADAAAHSSVFFRTGGSARLTQGESTDTDGGFTQHGGSGHPFEPLSDDSRGESPTNPSTATPKLRDEDDRFSRRTKDSATHGRNDLKPRAPPYTVMAGTVISAALVTGINSDLPGQVIATVTEPVYDTASGRSLIIPQGSRLIGRYDSKVSFGQRRALLVWTRLIMPDTSSVDLDKLPGIDSAGYAGLEDGVDRHWSRIIAGIAVSSLLGVSSELATSGRHSDGSDVVVALQDSLQDSANHVGQELTRRNLDVQPTLTVRPGFPMRVMVNKDLVLRPYQPLFVTSGAN